MNQSGYIDELIKNAPSQMFWIIVSFIVGTILTYFFQNEVRIFLNTLRIKYLYHDFRYRLILKASFSLKTKDLDSYVYDSIKEKGKEFKITKASLRPESMSIIPEELGTKINVLIDSVHELLSINEGESVGPDEYTLTIQLDSDLRLTYRRLEILEDYLILIKDIKKIVEDYCFSGVSEINSFMICEIIRDKNTITDKKQIEIEKEGTKISFKEKNVNIVVKNSDYLMRNISKYIGH